MSQHKHPRSLLLFCSTEFWERYGFYAVQSLLALYLSSIFHLTDFETYTLVGAFTALTYISPIVGGIVADRLLGQKSTVLLGAIFLFANYILLSFHLSFFMMTFALAGLACGTGLLKPNISSLLGRQYHKNSPIRDAGFIYFYMGITTGIILGTVLPPLIQKYLGWSSCYISAAFGLLLAFFIFYFGIKKYNIKEYAKIERHPFFNRIKAALLLLIMWDVAFVILSRPRIGSLFFQSIMVGTVYYVLRVIKSESLVQRKKTMVLLILCIISALFWAFYFQMFLSLTLFIARAVKPTVAGIYFPAPYYVAVESVAMLIIGVFMAKLSLAKRKTHFAVKTTFKFSMALFFMLIAYGFILLATSVSSGATLINPALILLAYGIIAIAELLLSPIGLSAVTRLASPERVSTMMGVFFISLGVGGYLSGRLAQMASIQKGLTSIVAIKANYHHAFVLLSYVLLASFVLSIVLLFVCHYLMKRHDLSSHDNHHGHSKKPLQEELQLG